MSASMIALGALIAAAGLAALGFGASIQDFELGHSLMIAGTVAVVGGVLVVGMGAVLKELRRIARAGERPAIPALDLKDLGLDDLSEPEPARPAASGRVPSPKPVPPIQPRSSRGEARPEPRPEPRPAPVDLSLDGELPPPKKRSGVFSVSRGGAFDPPIVEEPESVPLSPVSRTPPSPPPPPARELPPLPEIAPEPASEVVSRTSKPFFTRNRASTPAERSAERAARNLFDTVWPTDPKYKAGKKDEHDEPPLDELPAASESLRDERLPPPPVAEQKAPSILKAGVIDGMAYTLYTDGSIEAQLPQGVVRFASIDELRTHLDNQQ